MTIGSTRDARETEMIDRFAELESKRVDSSAKDLVWMAFGVLGNRLFARNPPDRTNSEGRRMLNLGCGAQRVEGWVNADFFRLHQWVMRSPKAPEWMVDLTHPLKCADNYWDGVFAEHVNEHLTYSQNYRLMTEVLRILKPSGRVRIVCPDLDKYLEFERLSEKYPKFDRYQSLPEAISNLAQNHAHKSVWNPALMSEMLERIGYDDVSVRSFGESADPSLCVDSPNHEWQSLYVEASKSGRKHGAPQKTPHT